VIPPSRRNAKGRISRLTYATFEVVRLLSLNMSMPLVEEYRRKAKVAEALAEATRDQQAKETYLAVAERWGQLAEQAERNYW
jgi:Tfp pilus assembly major pilin PilA